jgi:hypothetical protein
MLLTKKSLYLSLFFWASFFIYSKQIFAAPTKGLVNENFIQRMSPRLDALLAYTETILEHNINNRSELFNMIKEYAQLLKNFREYLAIRSASPDSHHYYKVYDNFFPICRQSKSIEVHVRMLKENFLYSELYLNPAFLDYLSLFSSYLYNHFNHMLNFTQMSCGGFRLAASLELGY